MTVQHYTVPAMKRTPPRLVARLGALMLIAGSASIVTQGQTPAAKVGEWPTYGADLRSTRYSRLDQINASNFNKLTLAWRPDRQPGPAS